MFLIGNLFHFIAKLPLVLGFWDCQVHLHQASGRSMGDCVYRSVTGQFESGLDHFSHFTGYSAVIAAFNCEGD